MHQPELFTASMLRLLGHAERSCHQKRCGQGGFCPVMLKRSFETMLKWDLRWPCPPWTTRAANNLRELGLTRLRSECCPPPLVQERSARRSWS